MAKFRITLTDEERCVLGGSKARTMNTSAKGCVTNLCVANRCEDGVMSG